MLGIKNRRRRQRTCQDLVCLFDSKCEIVHNQPHCTCRDVFCTIEEEQPMNAHPMVELIDRNAKSNDNNA